MPDSTAAHERGGDAGGLALVRGDGGTAERALRSVIQALEGKEGGYLELEAALVRLGAMKQETGNYGEAEAIFQKALEVGERAWGANNPGLLPAIAGLGAARMLGGAPDGVDALLARALEISESSLGEDHPDLVILLNDLARLCLKQSAHAFAEPLLLRLLAIKQGRGEEHPEVATVLASLAAVRQALGRHESAEQLWRRVLAIRERTLAPNHFALATAMEHLADSCAARGKLGEALKLYQRGQAIREATLGVDHPSLRISRERVADLQLQASEDLLDTQNTVERAPPAELFRLLPAERVIVPVAVTPATKPSTDAPVWKAGGSTERPVVEPVPVLPLVRAEAAGAVIDEPETSDYRGILLSMQHELESDEERDPSLGLRGAAIVAPVVAFFRRRQKEVVVGAVALTLLLLAAVSDSRAGNEADQPAGSEQTVRSEFPVAKVATFPQPVDRVADSRDRQEIPATQQARAVPVIPSRARALAESAPVIKAIKKDVAVNVPRAVVPRPLDINLESTVRGIATPVPSLEETFPVQSAPSVAASIRSSFGNADIPSTGVRARLIGPMPTPRYPLHALDVEGDVRVRVEVGPDGRPIMSTFTVVSSPHASLSAAARNVIPAMRFEPARTGGAQSRAISETVEMGFRFDRSPK